MNSKDKKIIVTGGVGFIGSNLIQALNDRGYYNVTIVDHMKGARGERKRRNLVGLQYRELIEADLFLQQMQKGKVSGEVEVVFHLGARTDTTEKDKTFLLQNNTNYSKELFAFCIKNTCRFIYASSAATYGDGSRGYSDRERKLAPLNYYGLSKYLFDEWVLDQKQKPAQWVGLKFFNVYGPNEYHKGFMASVVYHGFQEIKNDGEIRLFKSYKEDYRDGEQKRDFIYVKDVVKVMPFFLDHKNFNGIYNVGTGKASSFLDVANALFRALSKKPNIRFIDIPEEIKEKYQYFTQADMSSLQNIGYKEKVFELEDGIFDYVQGYLARLDSTN